MADELAAEISAIEDEIKAHMDKVGTDTLEAGKHVVRWAVVKSSRFDSKAFRETYPSIYEAGGGDRAGPKKRGSPPGCRGNWSGFPDTTSPHVNGKSFRNESLPTVKQSAQAVPGVG